MNIHFTVGQETDFLESGVVDRVRGMGDEESFFFGGGGGGGREKERKTAETKISSKLTSR